MQKAANPYAKPTGFKCYRCGQPVHRSNECPARRTIGLVANEEEEADDAYDDYDGAEFVEE